MYRVIGVVIYNTIDDYICPGYLGLLQENLSKNNNNFEGTKFNDSSGLVIPDFLMNIISCDGLSKSSILTVILTCHNALVSYYIFKIFVIVETGVVDVGNIPIIVKGKTNSDHLHQEVRPLTCKVVITSIFNILNKIIISRYVSEKYVSIFLMTVMMICITWSLNKFKQCLDELEHLPVITEWTSNMDKYAYK